MRLLVILLFFTSFAFSQQIDQKSAYQYYINGEYENAIISYKELIDKRFSPSYFIPYYSSLLKVKNFKLAESFAKNLTKKYPGNLQYKIGVILATNRSGNIKKSKFLYSKFLNKMGGGRSQAISAASFFSRYEFYEEALEIYKLSKEINPKNNFGVQKAQLYSKMGEVELMIKEFLSEMENNPSQSKMVTAKIQKFIDNDGIQSEKNYSLVKKLLLLKVNNEEDRTDFSEMLIWLFMQNNRFKMALVQAKAVDRRTNSNGEIVYDLAETFLDNEDFELAVQAYNYVISRGKNNLLYIDANINRLFALTKDFSKKGKDYSILNDDYKELIKELGANNKTVILYTNFAHFNAFYLHDLVAAENLLIDAMLISAIDDMDLAECKMEYADILLLKGNVWQSMLYYSQVEKDFKEHPIGHEAKLRRAKISYYQGDFRWAQAQLESLKASTSKFISNNAMELSLLITDNFNLDTTEIPMKIFAKADLLLYQQKYEDALLKYDSILNRFNGHALTDEIYMRKADIYVRSGQIENALKYYKKIDEDWSFDILADDALYKQAKIYDDMLNDSKSALLSYNKILIDYNSSIFVEESRRRIRELSKDNKINY